MKTKKIKNIAVGLLVALNISFLYVSCSKKEEVIEETPEIVNENTLTLNDKQIQSAGVVIDTLERKKINKETILNGTIEVPPNSISKVSLPGGGYIRSTKYRPGDYVRKGQSLATIENPELIKIQEEYLLAKSNYIFAKKNVERQTSLNRSKAISDKNKELAENEARNENLKIKSLEALLKSYGVDPQRITSSNIQKRISLAAPISGYITAVNVNVGQYVSSTEILFEIMNNSNIQLVLKAYEKEIPNLKVGQKVLTYTNQNPDEVYPTRISVLGKEMNADRSISVYCQFENFNPKLVAGSYMNGVVEEGGTVSWAIPDAGVVSWEDQQYIFQAKSPNTFEMIPITIGNAADGYTQISSINPNFSKSKYVVAGAYNLLMALKNEEE